MQPPPIPDIATRTDIGPRDRQEDRFRAVVNPDGSWVVAVADGLGGHPFGDESAQAAVEALPPRIANVNQMSSAFDAANAAAWALRPRLRSRSHEIASTIALTTLVVAAWTSEGGLLLSWLGDSMGFVLPVRGGPGWHSSPHNDRYGYITRCIGMSRVDRDSYELPPGDVGHMSGSLPREHVDGWIGDGGLLVVLATDGLYGPIFEAHHREGFNNDSDDNSLDFALPAGRRTTAADAAETLMGTARTAGLSDNTTIAVARIACNVSVNSTGSMAEED